MKQPQRLVYRINTAADKLEVSRSTIYRPVKAKQLQLIKVSKDASRITADSISKQLPGSAERGQ